MSLRIPTLLTQVTQNPHLPYLGHSESLPSLPRSLRIPTLITQVTQNPHPPYPGHSESPPSLPRSLRIPHLGHSEFPTILTHVTQNLQLIISNFIKRLCHDY